MFEEIQYLNDNLTSDNRGNAVRQVKNKIINLIANCDWSGAESFFYDYNRVFEGNISLIGILQNEFRDLVEKLINLDFAFSITMVLNHLQNLSWFEGVPNSQYKRGIIAEHMAPFGQGILEVAKLQEARNYYRRAHRDEDIARVQQLLTQKVTSFSCNPIPTEIPQNPVFEHLQNMVQEALRGWLEETNDRKMAMFVADSIGIRPDRYREQHEEGDDIMVSGFLEESGIIQTIGINPEDGRVNAGRMAPAQERIHFSSWEEIYLTFLYTFIQPVKEWLLSDEGDNKVFQLIGGSLVSNLNWDDNTTSYFMEGMNAWVSGYPQVALAFWLPHFESALRGSLNNLGEDVINPQSRPGIENFILFDSLLTKAENYFEEQTVEFWRFILSTRNGLGWNLRNTFCHGLLSLQAMKNDMNAFTVLQAYLFLLRSIAHEN